MGFVRSRAQIVRLLSVSRAAGSAMINAATRKAPHCFNFLRQIRILQKSGCGGIDQQMKDTFFGGAYV